MTNPYYMEIMEVYTLAHMMLWQVGQWPREGLCGHIDSPEN